MAVWRPKGSHRRGTRAAVFWGTAAPPSPRPAQCLRFATLADRSAAMPLGAQLCPWAGRVRHARKAPRARPAYRHGRHVVLWCQILVAIERPRPPCPGSRGAHPASRRITRLRTTNRFLQQFYSVGDSSHHVRKDQTPTHEHTHLRGGYARGRVLLVFNSPRHASLETSSLRCRRRSQVRNRTSPIGLARLGRTGPVVERSGRRSVWEDGFSKHSKGEGVDVSHVRWSSTAPTAVMFKSRRVPCGAAGLITIAPVPH